MAGLVPAIHDLLSRDKKDVDARDKPGHDEFGVGAEQNYAAAARRWSTSSLAGRGSALKLRAQITSLRLAQASRMRTAAIPMVRAQRLAAASGTTATPTSAATIWQIASKSRSRARTCSRMPSRAACFEM